MLSFIVNLQVKINNIRLKTIRSKLKIKFILILQH